MIWVRGSQVVPEQPIAECNYGSSDKLYGINFGGRLEKDKNIFIIIARIIDFAWSNRDERSL